MLDVITIRLGMLLPVTKRNSINIADYEINVDYLGKRGDLKQIAYVLEKMSDVLDHGGQLLANHLASSAVPARARNTHVMSELQQGPCRTMCNDTRSAKLIDVCSEPTYRDFACQVALR
jgi:hypothetical protein